MLTQLCQFLLHNRRPRLERSLIRQRGQSLIIFAVVMLGLIFFIGLAVDSGSLYLTYGQLKRAVDAAALAAANEFKSGNTLDNMNTAAHEVVKLHGIDMTTVDLHVYICDAYTSVGNGDLNQPYQGPADGIRDRYLSSVVPTFYNLCPNTDNGLMAPRKLVWVEGKQRAPFYFLSLLGFQNVLLETHATAEAAPVDLVLVFDVSESMGRDTPGFKLGDWDPTGCNASNTCQPLKQAKDAAKTLVTSMHNGYDQIAVVTFDTSARTLPIPNMHGVQVSLSNNMTAVLNAIDGINLHYDAPFLRMWPNWRGGIYAFNPVNPEDRDGNGADADPVFPTCAEDPGNARCCTLNDQRWDVNPAKFGAYPWGGGFPCDDPTLYDSYDWNQDGKFTMADDAAIRNFLDPNGDGIIENSLSPLSTCSGCGIREASAVLANNGRPTAVWVMVFLSDGAVNLSDMPPVLPVEFTNGFCYGAPLNNALWQNVCINPHPSTRYCIDTNQNTCPPGSIWENPATTPYQSLDYNVFDYALDVVDQAALLKSTNANEPVGNDIAIYTIGLGSQVGSLGEQFLRYMAAVGDDGDRTTDPCGGKPAMTTCGQYYYAPSADKLKPIFEDLASRIYTRLTQ